MRLRRPLRMSTWLSGKHLKTLAILFVLFGLPALSWLFLQKGLDHRVAILQELDSLGVAPVCLPLSRDSMQAPQAWKEETWLIAFVGENEGSGFDAEALLKRVYADMSAPAALNVLLFKKGAEQTTNIPPDQDKRWFEVAMEEPGWSRLATEGFHWPQKNDGKPESNAVALVNKEGVILNFYDLSDEEQIRKMIRHIAFINQ